MSGGGAPKARPASGIPPGMVEAVLAVLAGASGPVRRRAVLEELERRGHRISLAGLNRTLQYCREAGWTEETDAGIRRRTPPA